MEFLNNLKDRFKKADFTIAPNKKLKTISKEFKNNFDLSLVFYKGNMIADGDLTIAGLNKKTSSNIEVKSDEKIIIKASMKVDGVENLFMTTYGIKVQIKDAAAKNLINDNLTLGKASRGVK